MYYVRCPITSNRVLLLSLQCEGGHAKCMHVLPASSKHPKSMGSLEEFCNDHPLKMKIAKVEWNTYFPSRKYLTVLKTHRGRLGGDTVFVLLALYKLSLWHIPLENSGLWSVEAIKCTLLLHFITSSHRAASLIYFAALKTCLVFFLLHTWALT